MTFLSLDTLLNPGYFLEYFSYLGTLPLFTMLWRIFVDGGWLPAIFIFGQGFWKLWVLWRQDKFYATITFTTLAINIPKDNEQTPKSVEQIFTQISGGFSMLDLYQQYWEGKFQPTFSFEIVSIEGHIQFLVHCQSRFRDLIESAIYSQYPDSDIIEVNDYTGKVAHYFPDAEYNMIGSEWVLKKGAHLPLRTYIQFEHNLSENQYFKDPMNPMLEVMSSLKKGEQMWFQILMTPTNEDWKKEGEAEVDKMVGKKPPEHKPSFIQRVLLFPIEFLLKVIGSIINPEPADAHKKEEKKEDPFKFLAMTPGERVTVELAQQKLAKIGLKSKIRWLYIGKHGPFTKARFASMKGSMNQYNALNANSLGLYGPMVPKDDYFWQRWKVNQKKSKLMKYYCNRSNKGCPPYVLNTEELATIYHYPFGEMKTPTVKKTDARRGEPPIQLPTEDDEHRWAYEAIKQIKKNDKPAQKAPEDDEEDLPDNLPTAH